MMYIISRSLAKVTRLVSSCVLNDKLGWERESEARKEPFMQSQIDETDDEQESIHYSVAVRYSRSITWEWIGQFSALIFQRDCADLCAILESERQEDFTSIHAASVYITVYMNLGMKRCCSLKRSCCFPCVNV